MINQEKVGVEGAPFFGTLSGIGQYAKRLVETASKMEENSSINFEIIRSLMPHRDFVPPITESTHLTYRVIRWLPPIIYYQMFKRVGWAPPYDLVALRKYKVMLFFNFVAFPLLRKTKSIVVIYDLSFVYHPEYTQEKNLPYMLKFVPRSIKKANQIITISKNSKHEIMEYYKVPEDKITIVNPAVDHAVFKPQGRNSIAGATKRYGITKAYILSVCTLEPRKNLVGVLNAFDKLPENLKNKYSLVLVGGKGWLDGEIEAKYAQLASKYDLIKTGYIPDEDLPALYSGASVFVFPAFYEGFGMPPLEAMACGTPVITSNNSSLPEVVGGAAIMVKAEDNEELSKQIEHVLTDNQLAKSMREKGLMQAQKFSWQKSARELLNLLEKVTNK